MEGGVLVRVSKPSVFGTEKEPKIPILIKTTTSIYEPKTGLLIFRMEQTGIKLFPCFEAASPLHVLYTPNINRRVPHIPASRSNFSLWYHVHQLLVFFQL